MVVFLWGDNKKTPRVVACRFRGISLPDKNDLGGFDHPSLNYKPPKSLKMFNAGMVLSLSALLAVGLWSLLWFGVASFAKKQISNWVADEELRGNAISFENVLLSGYPGRITLTYDNPEISSPAISTRTERAIITIKPWTPWLGEIDLGGKTSMVVATVNGPYNLSGSIEKFNLVVNPGATLPDNIKLDIAKLDLVDGISNFGLKAAEIKINMVSNITAGQSSAAIKITAHAANMVLPWGEAMPISNQVQMANFSGKISGPLTVAGGIKEILANWRDGGGKVIVDSVVLHGNPLAISGGGNIYLDKNMQPAGRLTAKITGLLPTINRFRDAGLIRDSDAVVAKMTLAAFSQKTDDGRSFLNLGVEVKENIIYLGPIAIGKLPPLKWQQ